MPSIARRRYWTIARSFLYVFLVVGFLAGYAPVLVAGIGPTADLGRWKYGAWAFWLVGAIALANCAWLFATMAGTSPAHIETPRALITRGLYRHVRHPMYVSQLLVVLGWLLWTGSLAVLVYLVNYAIAVYLIATYYEEPRLPTMFDGPYLHYRRHVRAWWPSLRGYDPGARD